MFHTDVLIIGSGPAGASAALLCSTYGLSNMVVTKYRWLADSPRAHYINQRTMEIMKDIGVDEEIIQKASPLEVMGNVVFCTSINGEELGRLPYGANRASRKTDYAVSSPCKQCDLPQHLLEPILLSNAASRGSHVRFDAEYLDHVQDEDGVTVRIMDRLTGVPYFIRTKYLLGADGGNSKVAANLDLPMEGNMGISGSIRIIFNADLSKYISHRPGYLWWVLQPGANIGGIGMGLLRMVRPWNEWQIVWGYDINGELPDLSDENVTKIAHQLIGDDQVPIEIKTASVWKVNQMYATRYSSGRVFCLGDAVHRHPPSNGLGSNSSIQDAYNLIWKLDLVLKGKASVALLDSYNEERTPIGKQIVNRANLSIREFAPIFEALGLTDTQDVEKMKANMAIIKESSEEGAVRREKLRKAIELKSYEFATQGTELNIRYESSAILTDHAVPPVLLRDKDLYYQPSTFPGNRLPHVWFNKDGQEVSSLTIAGKGKFVLLTGIGGEDWLAAAAAAEAEFAVSIRTFIIGPGRDVQDLYGDWAEIREVKEEGCILVRPDGYIMWRSIAGLETNSQLTDVFRGLLGLNETVSSERSFEGKL
ncbi:FAD-dependent monooxygenase [Pedobacter sp. UYP1]|uniref:FAD-dependent oxidoreductase n=1 Tax=Pedobacter sp. UYP1 TaxID=1756396 RepID=UPI00339B3CC5